jgi:hypothetical protein
VAVTALGSFIVSVSARFVQLADPSTAVRASLAEMGLSAWGYALYNVGLDTVFVSVFAAVTIVIFWRRSDDAMALLVATMLVVWGPLNGLLVLTPSATEGDVPSLADGVGQLAHLRRLHGVDALLLPLSERALRAALDSLAGALLGTFLRFLDLHAVRPDHLAAPALQLGPTPGRDLM